MRAIGGTLAIGVPGAGRDRRRASNAVSIPERLFLVAGVAVLLAALALIVAMMIDLGVGSGDRSRSVSNVTLAE